MAIPWSSAIGSHFYLSQTQTFEIESGSRASAGPNLGKCLENERKVTGRADYWRLLRQQRAETSSKEHGLSSRQSPDAQTPDSHTNHRS